MRMNLVTSNLFVDRTFWKKYHLEIVSHHVSTQVITLLIVTNITLVTYCFPLLWVTQTPHREQSSVFTNEYHHFSFYWQCSNFTDWLFLWGLGDKLTRTIFMHCLTFRESIVWRISLRTVVITKVLRFLAIVPVFLQAEDRLATTVIPAIWKYFFPYIFIHCDKKILVPLHYDWNRFCSVCWRD